jgi:hypothetical protein
VILTSGIIVGIELHIPKLQLLVNALLKSTPSMGYVIVLLALIFYIYAVG